MAIRILVSASRGSWGNYERALRAAGGVPEGGYCPAVDTSFDGLLLTGGGDMDPSYFHQENDGSDNIDLARDEAELALVKAFMNAGKPILGICRGHQVLNVALGGSLRQDVGDELRPFHAHGDEEPDRVHPVRAKEGSLFHKLYGPLFSVNSAHHQALDAMGEGLIPTLWSESGVVEGMEHGRLPILATQFHPERMTGPRARCDTVDGGAIFRHFIDLCKG